jgi:hypothetical protein
MSDHLPLGHESEQDLVRRWPHLEKPGPQPHNAEVFDTLEEQLRFAMIPRAELQRQQRAKPLLQLLAKGIGRIVAHVVQAARGGKRA